MSKGWTQTDVESHYARIGRITPKEWPALLKPLVGPIQVVMTLYGHVPSKKNVWQRGGSGVMFIPTEAKGQIDAISNQAHFEWSGKPPIEHPDLTVTFYVVAKRQDQDGMYTTILDCLQAAGVIVNDNIAHFNGTKVLKPCVFVTDAQDERVDIEIRKDA